MLNFIHLSFSVVEYSNSLFPKENLLVVVYLKYVEYIKIVSIIWSFAAHCPTGC